MVLFKKRMELPDKKLHIQEKLLHLFFVTIFGACFLFAIYVITQTLLRMMGWWG